MAAAVADVTKSVVGVEGEGRGRGCAISFVGGGSEIKDLGTEEKEKGKERAKRRAKEVERKGSQTKIKTPTEITTADHGGAGSLVVGFKIIVFINVV